MWPPPINPNGPLDRIEYYIRWTTQTKQGISKAVKTDAIKYDALDPYNNGFFSRIIENLSPSHIYSVQVDNLLITHSFSSHLRPAVMRHRYYLAYSIKPLSGFLI